MIKIIFRLLLPRIILPFPNPSHSFSFLKKFLCVKLLSKLDSFPNTSQSQPTLHFDMLMMIIKIGFCNDCFPGFDPCLPVSYFILYQSAALPPLAAPAQTWKPRTANMNTLASTAAAASAQIHLGSALLVFSTQQLELDSGSQ